MDDRAREVAEIIIQRNLRRFPDQLRDLISAYGDEREREALERIIQKETASITPHQLISSLQGPYYYCAGRIGNGRKDETACVYCGAPLGSLA